MIVLSFYKFVPIASPEDTVLAIERTCAANHVVGTVLVASEGINATLGHDDRACLERTFESIKQITGLVDVVPKWSGRATANAAFDRLIVRQRREIVSLGRPFDFSGPQPPRITPDKWSKLIQDPETNVVDVRNKYEIRLGRFHRAIDPGTQNFREFTEWVANASAETREKQTAIYCTGGIRCEKAAQTLAASGFREIYQLDQGILGYFDAGADRSLWQGECFVFDKRVAITPDLERGTATQCHACRRPLTQDDRQSNHYVAGISCPLCVDHLTAQRREGLLERNRQVQLADQRNQKHIGPARN